MFTLIKLARLADSFIFQRLITIQVFGKHYSSEVIHICQK